MSTPMTTPTPSAEPTPEPHANRPDAPPGTAWWTSTPTDVIDRLGADARSGLTAAEAAAGPPAGASAAYALGAHAISTATLATCRARSERNPRRRFELMAAPHLNDHSTRA